MRWNARARRWALGTAAIGVAALAGVAAFHHISTARERRSYPPPGRLIDAGGYRLHIYCVGGGGPTVLFESGYGMTSNAWALVQPSVARLTRACSYDRPGYGWSDEPPDSRTGMRAVEDLHHALANGRIAGPYVVVGHSMGGGQVRLFASRYSREVAGMVIVASGNEDSPPSVDDSMDRMIQVIAALSPTGLPRLIGVLFKPSFAADYAAELRRYLPARAAESELTFLAQTRHARAMARETRAARATALELRKARDFGDLPLVVLSERPAMPANHEAARVEDQLQDEMSRWSRRGKHIRVDSGHMILLEKPGVIVDAVRAVLEAN